MKIQIIKLSLLIFCISGFVRGESVPTPLDSPEPVESTPKVIPKESKEAAEELDGLTQSLYGAGQLQQLAMGARFDTAFLTGSGLIQGFTLPSARLTVFGDLSLHVKYRFSLGQTREFSTVLLPQILPVEAFVDFSTRPLFRNESGLVVRMGMFTPDFHPLWTPDLSYLTLPTYHESHRTLFLGRELGLQVKYHSSNDQFEAGLAFVNGVGILSENSNNAKALALFVKHGFEFGSAEFKMGLSAFGRLQSSKGSLNFRQDWLALAWASMRLRSIELWAEYYLGEFEDSAVRNEPNGSAFMISVEVSPTISLWGRYETLGGSPSGATGIMDRWEVGPRFQLHSNLQLFSTYSQIDEGFGLGAIQEFRVQLRLNI